VTDRQRERERERERERGREGGGGGVLDEHSFLTFNEGNERIYRLARKKTTRSSSPRFDSAILPFLSLFYCPPRRAQCRGRPLNCGVPRKIRTVNRFASPPPALPSRPAPPPALYISGLRKSEVGISGNIYGLTCPTDTSSDKTG